MLHYLINRTAVVVAHNYVRNDLDFKILPSLALSQMREGASAEAGELTAQKLLTTLTFNPTKNNMINFLAYTLKVLVNIKIAKTKHLQI